MTATRTWTIGADPDCDVVIDRPTVSGRHCRLTESPAGYLLEDLQSTNGTYVNGRRISARVPIKRTDIVLLGSKVAFLWPDVTARPTAEHAPIGVVTAPVPRSIGNLQIAGGLCAVGLAAALLGYSVINTGHSRTGDPQTDVAASGRDATASSGERVGTASAIPRHAGLTRTGGSGTNSVVADVESLIAAQEPNVVWVGYRLRNYAFPYATGSLIRADRVVTTAATAADLEPLIKEGIEMVVWREGELLRVTSMHTHSAFDAENLGSQISAHSNIALLELEEALDTNCVIASPDQIAALGGAPSLVAIGFESQLQEHEPFDELKVKRLRQKVEPVSSELLASTSSRLYRLRAPMGRCWDGAPVFNERGQVTGILTAVAGEPRMVPINQALDLLELTDRNR